MPTITRVFAVKSGRTVKISFKDHPTITLSPIKVIEDGLTVGTEISESDLQQLKQGDDTQKYYLKALNLISFRARSTGEIRDYLKRQKISPEMTEEIITKLAEEAYLNDSEFADWFVRSRINNNPRGPFLLKAELYRKGLSNDIISQTLSKFFPDNESLLDLTRKIIAKKERSFSSLSPQQYRQKVSQYLSRLGFSYSTISSLIDETINKR